MPTAPRRLVLAAAAALAMLVAAPVSATAAEPGQDHPAFASIERAFGPAAGQESATDVVVQPDGKVVVAILNDAEVDRRIIRLMPDGSMDPTWGSAGVWHLPRPNATYVRSIALQADGKVVFAGEDATRPGIVVGRLTSAGALDVTFAGDGLHVIDTPTGSAPLVEEVLVEPSGRIVFAGVIKDSTLGDQLFLGRLTSLGLDDPDFHGPNLFRTFGSPYDGIDDSFGGLARMANGDFLIGDETSASSSLIYKIGVNGTYLIAANVPFPSTIDTPVDIVTVDATRAVVLLAGSTDRSGLAYLDVSGTPKLTTSGGNSGIVEPFPLGFRGHDLLLQSDGRWVIAGVDATTSTHRALARVHANGTIDPSFGTEGMRHLGGISSRSFYLDRHSIAAGRDGSLVSAYHVAGATTRMTAITPIVGQVARVRAEVVPPPAAGIVEQTTNFTVRATNAGPDAAGGGAVAFTVADGMRVMSVTGVGCTANAAGGTCRFGQLAAGATFDVVVRVRASRPGFGSIAAAVNATTWDDDTTNDSATGGVQFDPAPAAAAAAKPAAAAAKPMPLALTLHRVSNYQGRLITGCGTFRRMCVVSRVPARGRFVHAYLRAGARPVPASKRRNLVLVMQIKVRGRWVTRHRPTLPVGASGATDVRLPRQWRQASGTWRLRTETVVRRGQRATVSRWLMFRVR